MKLGHIGLANICLLALVLLAAANCTMPKSELPTLDVAGCGSKGYPRVLGQRSRRLVSALGRLDDYCKRDFVTHNHWQALSFEFWRERQALATRQTGQSVAGIPGAVSRDFDTHLSSMEWTLRSYFEKLKRDTNCFFARAWNDLKVLD